MSYRACFKPQLPRFFISRLTEPGERVYDPFMGRGTTVIEAALLGRTPAGCDINQLSLLAFYHPLTLRAITNLKKYLGPILVAPRLDPPGDCPKTC